MPSEVTSVAYVTPELGFYESVGPDGSLLVVASGICVEPTDSEGSDTCATLPGGNSVGDAAGGWAGDGSRFVFHDRLTTATTFESTVLSLDRETGDIAELIVGEGLVAMDVAVSADGSDVVVSGSSWTNASGAFRAGTFAVGPDGALERISEVPGENIEWLPDSSGLVVSARGPDHQGVFIISPDGGSARLVGPDDILGPPFLAAVSGDGQWALVHWQVLVARDFFPAGVPFYSLLSLDDGDLIPLRPEADDAGFVGPVAAAFSPDSDRVAYVYFGGEDREGPLVLATRRLPNGAEVLLNPDLFATAGSPPNPDTLLFDGEPHAVWTDDDRLVLRTRSWAMVLELG